MTLSNLIKASSNISSKINKTTTEIKTTAATNTRAEIGNENKDHRLIHNQSSEELEKFHNLSSFQLFSKDPLDIPVFNKKVSAEDSNDKRNKSDQELSKKEKEEEDRENKNKQHGPYYSLFDSTSETATEVSPEELDLNPKSNQESYLNDMFNHLNKSLNPQESNISTSKLQSQPSSLPLMNVTPTKEENQKLSEKFQIVSNDNDNLFNSNLNSHDNIPCKNQNQSNESSSALNQRKNAKDDLPIKNLKFSSLPNEKLMKINGQSSVETIEECHQLLNSLNLNSKNDDNNIDNIFKNNSLNYSNHNTLLSNENAFINLNKNGGNSSNYDYNKNIISYSLLNQNDNPNENTALNNVPGFNKLNSFSNFNFNSFNNYMNMGVTMKKASFSPNNYLSNSLIDNQEEQQQQQSSKQKDYLFSNFLNTTICSNTTTTTTTTTAASTTKESDLKFNFEEDEEDEEDYYIYKSSTGGFYKCKQKYSKNYQNCNSKNKSEINSDNSTTAIWNNNQNLNSSSSSCSSISSSSSTSSSSSSTISIKSPTQSFSEIINLANKSKYCANFTQKFKKDILLCSICSSSPKQFGLLTDCDHVFCLDCIKVWRRTDSISRELTRKCPVCQKVSLHFIPSDIYCHSGPLKTHIIERFRSRCSRIPCKFYEKKGPFNLHSCPFGNECLFLHRNPDGTDEKSKNLNVNSLIDTNTNINSSNSNSNNINNNNNMNMNNNCFNNHCYNFNNNINGNNINMNNTNFNPMMTNSSYNSYNQNHINNLLPFNQKNTNKSVHNINNINSTETTLAFTKNYMIGNYTNNQTNSMMNPNFFYYPFQNNKKIKNENESSLNTISNTVFNDNVLNKLYNTDVKYYCLVN